MKIAIIGAGAMGCIFGGFLSRAGHEVWLVGRREPDIDTINERGVILSMGEAEEVTRPKATTKPAEVGTAELVLFSVKSFDTTAAAHEAVPMVGPNTYAMTFQNGISNIEVIMSQLGMDRVIYGISLVAGSMKGPGHVKVDAPSASHAPNIIAEWNNRKSQMALKICQAFNDAGITTEIAEDAQQLLWTTFATKAGIIVITALTRLKIGDVLDQDEGRELLSLATSEIVNVAKSKGVEIDFERIMQYILSSIRETGREHVTSMLTDFRNKRRTEVDSLAEAIVREAEQLGLSAPVNKTMALLARIIEKTYEHSLGS